MIREEDLPSRIIVGKNGAYWRDYGDYYSMCPVSEDNDPVEPVAIYVRAKWSEFSKNDEEGIENAGLV